MYMQFIAKRILQPYVILFLTLSLLFTPFQIKSIASSNFPAGSMESVIGGKLPLVQTMNSIMSDNTFGTVKITKEKLKELKAKAKANGGNLKVIISTLDTDNSGAVLPKDKDGLEQKKGKIKTNLDKVINKKGFLKDKKLTKFDYSPTLATTMSEGDFDAISDELDTKNNSVVDVSEDFLVQKSVRDFVPFIGANATINGRKFTGAGQMLFMVDDGLNAQNQMVAAKITGSMCVNPINPGANDISFCPPGPASNGDTTYTDAYNSAIQCTAAVVVNSITENQCSHGTITAAAAGGIPNIYTNDDGSTITYSGVAPGVTFYPIQASYLSKDSSVCASAGLPSGTLTCDVSSISMLQKSLELILNLVTTNTNFPPSMVAGVTMNYATSTLYNSFCDTSNAAYTSFNNVIKSLRQKNIPVIVPAGNSTTTNGGSTTSIAAPACLSSVIAVAASSPEALPDYGITGEDQIPGYAFNNQNVKLLAPDTANLPFSTLASSSSVDYVKVIPRGSSISAALVAGAFAQLKQAKPTATLEEMLNALQKTGKPIADTRYGNTKKLVKPRIQIDKAIDFLLNNTAGSTVFWYNSTSATSAWWDISKSGTVTNSSNYSQNVSVTGPGTSGSALLSVNTGGSLYGSPYPKGFKVGNIADFNGDGVNDIDWIPTWARIPDIRSFYMVGCYPNSCYGYNAYESIYPTTYGSNGWNISSCTILPNCDVSSAQSYFWYLNTATGTQAPNTLLKSTYNNPTAIRDYWNTPIASDLNRDGIADLLFRGNDNPFKGNISNTFDTRDLSANAGLLNIWYMGANGQPTSFGQINATVADTKWQITALADFNGDGNKDILWRNDTTGETLIWQLDSSSRFVQGKYLPTVTGWKLEGVADYDLDGKPELVWDEQGSSTNQVHWSINSDFTYGPGAQTSKPTNATFTDYRGSYDVNGDGIDDKVWQVSGQPIVQIMDHSGLISTTWNTLPNPTSAWMIQKNKLK